MSDNNLDRRVAEAVGWSRLEIDLRLVENAIAALEAFCKKHGVSWAIECMYGAAEPYLCQIENYDARALGMTLPLAICNAIVRAAEVLKGE